MHSVLCRISKRAEEDYKGMAEREGFEPPVPFRVRRFSRPEPSTTRPPLRLRTLLGYRSNLTRDDSS